MKFCLGFVHVPIRGDVEGCFASVRLVVRSLAALLKKIAQILKKVLGVCQKAVYP